MESVELLSPAGDFQTALAAFEAGADAVYCGLVDFSARAFATNFSFEDLENLLAYAHNRTGRALTPGMVTDAGREGAPGTACPRKVYVTFNTLLDEDQFDGAIETLARLEDVGPDGVIVQDLGVAKLIHDHFPSLALHASTQLVAHNLEGVLALGELGFTRVVLARELSVEEIALIAKRCGGIELEVFIHGALCYSLSGLCLFGAMEKGRSGNRGKCPYCCREQQPKGSLVYPFSMKDLRLGDNVKKLAETGVASLKIEGRMKSPLYVASVTKYYRDILNGVRGRVSIQDLETVFSRRTTELYFNGRSNKSFSPVDAESLGHLGTLVGVVKKVTRDREGRSWLRFHTSRGLEKHDGLQFEAMTDEGRHLGMGIVEMRQAISRRPVFEVNAGVDVEVLVAEDVACALKPGMKIYCSMSNAVKRLFPMPSFRPSDYEGGKPIDVEVTLKESGVSVSTEHVQKCENLPLEPAKDPSRTAEAIRKAFAKLGGTGYRLGELKVNDPDGLFVPMSVLNDLRRDLVESLDESREKTLAGKIEAVKAESFDDEVRSGSEGASFRAKKRVKIRADQTLPPGDYDEVIVAINADSSVEILNARLALPVYTSELTFNKLRSTVKRFLRAGFEKWEASDLATLRMLKELGVTDLTADWTLYAFNARALAQVSALGVKRFVASPENGRENLQYLAESGYDVEFLTQQSTPLFVSLTSPASPTPDEKLRVFVRDGLWVTTKPVPRTFDIPDGVSTRLDLSWDPL